MQNRKKNKVTTKDQDTNKLMNDKRNKGRARREKKNEESDYGLNTSSGQVPDIVVRNKKRDNDASWYMHIEGLPKDFGNLNFSQSLGLGQYYLRQGHPWTTTNTGQMTYTAPGIMTIYFEPTIGQNHNGPKSAINLAAQQLYTLVRVNLSAPKNYDKTDLMMLIMAMDSAYMLYEDLLRAYRVIGSSKDRNRYYPTNILHSLGYSETLRKQLSEFRGVLDSFAYDLANVNIPDQFSIVERHSWMVSNIYLDDEDPRGQSFAFIPKTIYVWTEGTKDPTTGNMLTPNYLKRTIIHDPSKASITMDLNDIKDLIDSVMTPILGSQNVGDMSGDLRKAFGEAGMIKIHPVEDYAVLNPVYSKEVSLQIRSIFSTTSPISSVTGYTGDITQVLDDVVSGPYLQQKLASSVATADGGFRRSIKPILNFIDEDTSIENILVATRLITLCDPAISGGISPIGIYGTEIVVSMKVWYLNPDMTYSVVTYDQDMSSKISNPNGTTQMNNRFVQALVSCFSNAPVNYLFAYDEDNSGLLTELRFLGPETNMCKYMFLDDNALLNMHETAVLSLFACKDYKLNR